MSSGVTSNGFENKTFEEIRTSITDAAQDPANFGQDFPVTPDSVFGILANIFAAEVKDSWDLMAAVADQQNRDKAEGKYLDDLAALVDVLRLKEAGSKGPLLFTGSEGTVVPPATPVQNITRETVLTDQTLTLNRTACNKTLINISTVANSTLYTLTLGSTQFDFTSDVDATAEEIITFFEGAVNATTDFITETTTEVDSFLVRTVNEQNTLAVSVSSNMTITSVSSLIVATAIIEGSISFSADSLTSLPSPVSGITSVTNPFDFSLGRLLETDQELRVRLASQAASSGKATVPSIQASIQNEVPGVTSAIIIENTSSIVDVDGRPPKSYELFITGGEESDIADVVWDTKPAGIETHGDITRLITDLNGDVQAVKFSRTEVDYAWIRVTYILNTEETFPANGESAIADALVVKGTSMYVGEDFDPHNFFGTVYQSASGIFVTLIEISVTDNANDSPTFDTAVIPIDKVTSLLFDKTRIIFSS